MTGKIYGIGLGPGDPDLITRKAARLIENARVIAYPTLAGKPSFARTIAAALIPEDVVEIAIDVPMTVARDPAQAAYDLGAKEIALQLEAGKDVVVLCEGDPLFYGSFMYLQARLTPRFACEIVPGVTSLTGCAASLKQPLCARDQILLVLPATLAEDELRAKIGDADCISIMKVGRHLEKVKAVVQALGLEDAAKFVAHASLPQERALSLIHI